MTRIKIRILIPENCKQSKRRRGCICVFDGLRAELPASFSSPSPTPTCVVHRLASTSLPRFLLLFLCSRRTTFTSRNKKKIQDLKVLTWTKGNYSYFCKGNEGRVVVGGFLSIFFSAPHGRLLHPTFASLSTFRTLFECPVTSGTRIPPRLASGCLFFLVPSVSATFCVRRRLPGGERTCRPLWLGVAASNPLRFVNCSSSGSGGRNASSST